MKIGIYPGTFDPVTNGHLDIILRANSIVDKLIVAVLFNPDKLSNTLFDVAERVELLKETTKDMEHVEVDFFSGLLVDYMMKNNVSVIIRGLRTITDFEYEMQMAHINKNLANNIETLFMVTSTQYGFLNSSSVRQLGFFGGDVSDMVPGIVEEKIREKYKTSHQ
ncbi:MAG: pantetheine-phosphate adenylyltransferase [Epulopiscium sp. Nuni2H_MBin001]|nr:MAG: pantetheine-phosphate adenylyltransferase [Epulopiscium sp. Nuni2H_MBin001]